MATGPGESERSDATASSSMDSHTDDASTEVPSILSRLRSPTPSDLSRKRKISSNPPKRMKKGIGSASSEPSNVSISDRVFSLLSNSFTERQACCMEDYIETSVTVQC